MPQAITAFLESVDFETCLRLSVSLGGDCDTLTCISAAIAEAFYKDIPRWIVDEMWKHLLAHFQLSSLFSHVFADQIHLFAVDNSRHTTLHTLFCLDKGQNI